MFAEKYGPWAVIAGGSEGVGACFARRIASQGVNIVLLARKPEPLEEVAQELRRTTSVEVRAASVDLAAPDLRKRMEELTGDVEVGMVVYNAGAESRMVPFLDRPFDQLMGVVGVNVLGTTAMLYHFALRMRERRRGGIILVGSLAGFAGGSRMAVYTASKAYEQMLGESLWYELRPHGIDVLTYIIGTTRTPAMARLGLNMEGMPVMEPDDVAAEGLANLENGPTWIAGAHNREAAKFLCTPDRKTAVEAVSASGDAVKPGS
jgi:uncharacterized protein